MPLGTVSDEALSEQYSDKVIFLVFGKVNGKKLFLQFYFRAVC